MSKVKYYNCDKYGHYDKDCPHECRARGPPIGGRLSSLTLSLQDIYQDLETQTESLLRYEDTILGVAST